MAMIGDQTLKHELRLSCFLEKRTFLTFILKFHSSLAGVLVEVSTLGAEGNCAA